MSEHELRRKKVEALRASGVDPFPRRFERTATAAQLHAAHAGLAPEASTGRTVRVGGRLVGQRQLGRVSFGVLADGSGRIQLLADAKGLGERLAGFDDLDVGDWVGVEGEVITTRTGELSVRVSSFWLLAKSLHPLPEKWHGLTDMETRHRQRYLDLIANPEARQIAELRIAVVRALRSSFERRGFLEVETPMLQIQPGGALANPFMTHHRALGLDMYLRIAPELYLKRLVIGGMEKVFELNRNFRNEGVSPKHNPEFTMLEAYQAFADYTDIMTLTEEVMVEVTKLLTGGTRVEYGGQVVDLTPPWKRIDYLEAVRERFPEVSFQMPLSELAELARRNGVDPHPAWGHGKVIAELFEAHREPEIWDPTFVFDYPTEVSPLARTRSDDPNRAEKWDLIVVGQEFATAFSELNDPDEQRRRFESQATAKAAGEEETHPLDEDYLLALEYGLPPTGGLGLGVDRFVMLLAGATNIREVILFPHLRPQQ